MSTVLPTQAGQAQTISAETRAWQTNATLFRFNADSITSLEGLEIEL